MLGHLSFGVADLQRAIAFYDAALGALGYARVWTAAAAAGYGEPGGNDRPGPGFHLAFVAQSRAAVERFHAAALAAGGTDEGAPGLRPHYGPNYYAAFVRDPDGHKLEAVFQ